MIKSNRIDKYPCEVIKKTWCKSGHYEEGICDNCLWLVEIFKHKFCGHCPGRCALHQVIRSQLHGCIFCENYTKKLDCAKCEECMDKKDYMNKKEDFMKKNGAENVRND